MPDQTSKPPSLRDMAVLLVSGDPARMERARSSLQGAVGELYAAAAGQEGMYAFARHRPDMVVTAANLPGMSGTAMVLAIRDINPDTAVVMAVDPYPEVLAAALAVKADAYVLADAGPEALLAAMESCVADIARHKELEQQRGLTELLLGGLPNPAMLLDRETRRIILANTRAKRLGLDAGTVLTGPMLPVESLAGPDGPDGSDPFGPLATYQPVQVDDVQAFGRTWDITIIPVSQHAVLHFAVDITDRKEAERALIAVTMEKEQYRRNLEAIFQSIPDAILTVDTNLEIIETNKSLEDICGLGSRISVGTRLDGIPETVSCGCLDILRSTLATRRPVKERRMECAAGNGQVLVANSAPLVDSDGNFTGAVLVMRDITRLEELEKTLRERSTFGNIVGKSEPMQRVYTLLEHLADADATVLITGESGTGKELVADAVHYGGKRASGPLVKVNCAALSENLLESELFGHVRGAFTGASADKVGRFQAAQGGTVLLDEIGDISPGIQLKLLRFLESREFERVGDSRTLKADVRVVAATNVDLMDKVRQGLFREDLYYRLKVMVIGLPALRERREDIPLLAEHFMARFGQSSGKHFSGLSPEVMALFMTHPWPGNVRELKHALEHAAILCPGGEMGMEHLPRDLVCPPETPPWSRRSTDPEPATPQSAPPASDREVLLGALERTGWNKAKAARQLGIGRCTLYRRLERLGIPDPD